MGLRLSFFSTPKHRVFNYQPRFYNPDKEVVEQARAKYALEKGRDAEDKQRPYVPGSTIRGSFKHRLETQRRYPKNSSKIRWVVIVSLVILFIAGFYAFDLVGVLMNLL